MKKLQEDKKKLEEKITKILNDFQKKYDVLIQEVDLTTESCRNANGDMRIRNVKAFIKVVF